jgi:hypothetical protein
MHKYLQGGCENDSGHDVDLLKKRRNLKSVLSLQVVLKCDIVKDSPESLESL